MHISASVDEGFKPHCLIFAKIPAPELSSSYFWDFYADTHLVIWQIYFNTLDY